MSDFVVLLRSNEYLWTSVACLWQSQQQVIPLAAQIKVSCLSVNWMSSWCWCQKHLCRCAAVTTGGSVVTFCHCGGIFFTSGSCGAGGRAVSPSAAPRSSTVCQRYSWPHPVGDLLQHAEEGGKLKWNKYSELYILICGQSVSPPAGGVLLLNWDPGAIKGCPAANVKPVFLHLCPSSAKQCWAADVWPEFFRFIEQRQNDDEQESSTRKEWNSWDPGVFLGFF